MASIKLGLVFSLIAIVSQRGSFVRGLDDNYHNEMMARIDKLVASIVEKRRIEAEKRKNLQFMNEDVLNVSYQEPLLSDFYDREREELKILQLIGNDQYSGRHLITPIPEFYEAREEISL